MDNISSIKILGSGTIPTGNYDTVSVIGEAEGTDNFTVNFLKIIGQLIAHGSVKAEDAKILGEMICNEASSTNRELDIMGRLTANTYYKCDKVKVYGEGIFKDILEFNEIEVLGALEVFKNCKGNRFFSKGKLDLKGILSAEMININPWGKSFVNEMNGKNIRIKNKNLFNLGDTKISSKVIHGNTVELEDTDCGLVTGEDIIILGNCNIDRVEYINSIHIDVGSSVKEQVKVNYKQIE